MRPRRGLAALALAFSSVTVITCIYPTERDSSVHVSLTPIHILFSGHDTVATARVWQVRGPGDSVPIPNVVFAWSSSNANAATVDNTGKIVGIASGTTVIRAAASNFDKGQVAAADTLRVSAPIEVDSIRPRTVRYGEFLSVYGVGVDSIRVATLDSAALIPNSFADTAYAEGTQRRRYWVPFPARTDSLIILGIYNGNGVFGFVRGETTKVVERDIYEPDDTIPAPIDLDAPPPFAAVPALVFFNPALAFERLKRGEKTGVDWYHFTQAETRDLTITLTAPQIAGTFLTFLTDSLGWNSGAQNFVIGHDSWTFGPGSHDCHGARFSPSEGVGDSTIVAFKNLRAGSLDGVAIYTAAGRYGLAVVAGYQSELPADAHEDDNSCNAADLRDTLQPPFRDTLAIENPHDVDWLRVHLTASGLLGTTYQFRLHALPGVHPDSLKDLDLYVLKVPQSGDTVMKVVVADTSTGSDANLTTTVTTTGDYYVTAVDFAGTATMYEVCVGTVPVLGTPFCNNAFPSPPLAARVPPISRHKRGRVPSTARLVPSRR